MLHIGWGGVGVLSWEVFLLLVLCLAVLAKQAEKKAILEKIEQGKRASRNNRKRLHPPNDSTGDHLTVKRPKSGGGGGELVSNSPSPLTLNSSRPASVLSTASTGETMNGEEPLDHQGSTDGSETNLEVAGAGTTPIRKLGKSRLGGGAVMSPGGSNRKVSRASAPLGGRGKMQKSGGKKVGASRSAAAASAGAIAGAKAATSAAYAAYGLPPTHHLTTPSPGGSPAVASSTQSSPRVSPVPMAFVATSLVTTPPTSKGGSKLHSSLSYANKNNF